MGSRGTSLKKIVSKLAGQRWGNYGEASEDRDVPAYKDKHEKFIKNSLTADEGKSLRFYSKHGDELMNAILREGIKDVATLRAKRPGYRQDEYEYAFKDIKHIKSAMEKSKAINDKHITLTRGTGLKEFQVTNFDQLKKLKGKTGITEGFYSTTTDKQPPWNQGVVVHISKPAGIAGVHMESVSHYESEHETLLNNNQSYYVNDVKIQGSTGHVYITMLNA